MRIQVFIHVSIAIMLAVDTFAQTEITSQRNGYRDGDKIYRVVAKSTSPGDRGENCVWKLPSTQKEDDFIVQTVYLRNDSLTISEGDFLLHYIATDKDMSMCGFQKRGMYCVHDKLLPELKYPFAYGDSISGTYSRKTTYYDMFSISGDGECYTVCDGIGVLTDGNETLKDVLRIHHHNTIVSKYDGLNGTDAGPTVSEVTEDKYLWYSPGCRYPVMDTRIVSCRTNGKIVSDTTFTSLYMPELQVSELAYDDANYELIAQKEKSKQYDNASDNETEKPFPIKMSASLQDDGREVELDYYVSGKNDCTFYAHDLSGRLLGSVIHTSIDEGRHQETLVLKNRPMNDIVMLTMVAGNAKQVVKVR